MGPWRMLRAHCVDQLTLIEIGRCAGPLPTHSTMEEVVSGVPLSRRTLMRGAVLLGVGGATGGLELLGGAPALAVPAPTIASCATWGARNPSDALTILGNNPNKILIHHTATANSTDYSLAHAYALSRS